MSAAFQPEIGDFLSLRGREWLVQDIDAAEHPHIVRLACVSDDAQGETAEIILDAEVGAAQIDADPWSAIGKNGTDSAPVFAAFLRTLKWKSATAADRDLFQAPFRAGIRLDAYQLLRLRKALRLPRVNLLIADDVGLGKTVEAGLIMRELLLRRRIDFVLVSAPPSMLLQWQDELAAKFGLAFDIIDRDRLAAMRRERGFGANPWRTGSRFILSHRLLVDETYIAGLREVLGEFRPRSLLILDEAHHAAPASGSRYAIDSQFTKACPGSPTASSIGSSSPRRRTTGIRTRSPGCSRCSTRSASPAACTCARAISIASWSAASRPICAGSMRTVSRSASSRRSRSMRRRPSPSSQLARDAAPYGKLRSKRHFTVVRRQGGERQARPSRAAATAAVFGACLRQDACGSPRDRW